MKLTQSQIQLVKQTWSIFRSIDTELVGDVFYGRLFLENPALRRMFPKQMELQYKKLINMLSIMVARLDHIDDLAGDIAAMAERHVQYGVKPEHYPLVGKALLWALQNGLGKDWNKEVESAWQNCYEFLSDTMIKASTAGKLSSN